MRIHSRGPGRCGRCPEVIFVLRLEEELVLSGAGEGKSVLGCLGRNGGVSHHAFIPGSGSWGDRNAIYSRSLEGGAAQEMQSPELGRMSLRCCQCEINTEHGQDSGRQVSYAGGFEDHQYSCQNYYSVGYIKVVLLV